MNLPAASREELFNVANLKGRFVRLEVYYTVWFNTKYFHVLITFSRGKPRGIKPDFRINPSCPYGSAKLQKRSFL
jgi:hypothetical protein